MAEGPPMAPVHTSDLTLSHVPISLSPGLSTLRAPGHGPSQGLLSVAR